jgi:hypothetical protein
VAGERPDVIDAGMNNLLVVAARVQAGFAGKIGLSLIFEFFVMRRTLGKREKTFPEDS